MSEMNLDAWDLAGEEVTREYEYYGQVEVDCVLMVFPCPKGSKQKPVPYDPEAHKGLQPFTEITMQLSLIPECPQRFPISGKWSSNQPDWTKITMPSIKALGFVNADGRCDLRAFQGSWVKCTRKDGFRKNVDPEKGNYKTLVFTAAYKSMAQCQDAFMQEHGQFTASASTEQQNASASVSEGFGNPMALQFIQSVASDASKKNPSIGSITNAVASFLLSNAGVCAGWTMDSPEIKEIIEQASIPEF